MRASRLAGAALSAVLGLSLATPLAFAQSTSSGGKSGAVAGVSTSNATAGIGQSLSFCLAANPSSTPTVTLTYPGDNTNLVVDASMTNLIAGDTSSVGFQVFDAANGSTAIETANLGNNEAHNDPSTIEFAYSSGNSGMVTLRPFNFSVNQVCFTVSPMQLPSGVGSLTLNGSGTATTPKPSAAAAPSGAPVPRTPISSKSAGIGQSLSFCLAPNAGSAPTITLPYPGDNSNLVMNSSITGLNSGDTTSAGFNVFDVSNNTVPQEIINLANNELGSDPHMLQFAYSSSTNGQVQIRPFNGSPNQVCFSLTPVQLPNGVGTVSLV